MVIGEKMRARREELDITVDRLSKLIGVNKSTITRYESNSINSMPYITFFRLLIALQITPREILPPEEYELIEKSDELRGFYEVASRTQQIIAEQMKGLYPSEEKIVDAVIREMLKSHAE